MKAQIYLKGEKPTENVTGGVPGLKTTGQLGSPRDLGHIPVRQQNLAALATSYGVSAGIRQENEPWRGENESWAQTDFVNLDQTLQRV